MRFPGCLNCSPALLRKTIDLVTLTRPEAEELFNDEPSIATVLQEGWKAGSFKEVCQLAVSRSRLPGFLSCFGS